MNEALVQSFQNLRANKLRSFLTMFGILWGMISVVVLSATGEGFRRGNEKVLRELGKNIGIVWGGRTSLQAGGERAGRQVLLTIDDARAIAAVSSMVAVVSPELERGAVKVKSAYNAAMARDLPRRDAVAGALSDIIVAPKDWVVDELPRVLDERTGRIEDVDWPLEQNVRAILARRHGFDPQDLQAIAMWDTSLNTLMFARMIGHMKQFFTVVGIVTLALGGIGVMNIMLIAVKERTREIGVRKALGATTRVIQRQFFLEGLFLTLLSGGAGMVLALGLCQLVNLAPMPDRFSGMILSWQSAVAALATLVTIGIVTSTYPARKAADLPPVEALRFEM